MAKKVKNDEIFQGNLTKENYFEGWYFKFVSKDAKHSFALIPGISLKEEDKHSFVQYINGQTGESEYFRFDSNEFQANKNTFEVHIGENRFSSESVSIKLKNDTLDIQGQFSFAEITQYPSSLLCPTIMGWFAYIPMMECNHGVVSLNHTFSGELMLNQKKIDFNEERVT